MMRKNLAWIAIIASLLAPISLRAATLLHERRQSASDLEVSGLLRGVPHGKSRFIARRSLEIMPQTTATVTQNEDFPGRRMLVTGVYLDVLAKALGAAPDAIEAVCGDGYAATFSPDYLRKHRPLLALRIDGLETGEWAKKNHAYDAGYFVAYRRFVPAFQVLSHMDQPLEPAEIVRLRFDAADVVYAAIKPKADADQVVLQGFRIGQQNCYRCHNSGDHGGTKAGKDWQALGKFAAAMPERFQAWVHDPQALDRKAKMPPNPQYDRATLIALTRYFQTFSRVGD